MKLICIELKIRSAMLHQFPIWLKKYTISLIL